MKVRRNAGNLDTVSAKRMMENNKFVRKLNVKEIQVKF